MDFLPLFLAIISLSITLILSIWYDKLLKELKEIRLKINKKLEHFQTVYRKDADRGFGWETYSSIHKIKNIQNNKQLKELNNTYKINSLNKIIKKLPYTTLYKLQSGSINNLPEKIINHDSYNLYNSYKDNKYCIVSGPKKNYCVEVANNKDCSNKIYSNSNCK